MKRFGTWIVALTSFTPACLSVIDADEYRISDNAGPGASGSSGAGGATPGSGGSGGASAGTPGANGGSDTLDAGDGAADAADGDGAQGIQCGSDEVPVAGETCERVGVTDCSTVGFELDSDGACRAVMPGKDCSTNGLAFPQSQFCSAPWGCSPGNDGYPPDGALTNIVYVYAQHFSCTERGKTKSCPYTTIGEALASLGSSGGGNIFVHTGVYVEDLVIKTSNVSIYGCGQANIVGASSALDPASPCAPVARPASHGAAICIPSGVTGVTLDGVDVGGPGYGVLAYGSDVTLRSSSIHDTKAYGLLVQEAKTSPELGSAIVPAKATLDHVSILRAGGVGIQVEGSVLEMRNSSVQTTSPLNPAPPGANAVGEDQVGLARGIALYPSMWSRSEKHADPGDFALSSATIELSAITGNQEMGVYASGADPVIIKQSVLGGLGDESSTGRALVAERSLATGARTVVTVDHSVIEHARDAAVDVRDATLTLTQTTIRDTLGRSSDRCSGQGVRVRSLPTVDAARSEVTLDHVSVLNSRQSAVFVAASTVHLENTLLRGVVPVAKETTAACAKAMGDGLTVESYAGLPRADVDLDRVRIDGASRTGLFAGDATVSATSSVIECAPVVDATGKHTGEAFGALCGCGATLAPCAFESSSLPSWATAGPSPAWPDRTNMVTACVVDTSQPDRALKGAALWNYLAPETLPVMIPNNGCADLSGLGLGRSSIVFGKPGFDTRAMQAYFWDPLTALLGRWASAPLGTGYATSGWPIGAPLVEIVQAPAHSLVTLDRFDVLTGEDGVVLPMPVIDVPRGYNGQGLIMRPEGGWYSVTITPPARFTCKPTGLEDATPTTLPIHVVPGLTATAYFDCTAEDPVTVVATAQSDIVAVPNTAGESPLGNLAADCMRSTIETAAFAFVPLNTIFGKILAGDVTWFVIDGLFSDARVAEATLTGEQIYDLLNDQFAQFSNRFVAVSGLRYDWDSTRPLGQRVVMIYDAQGVALDRLATYSVVFPYHTKNPSLNLPMLQSAVVKFGPPSADSFATCIRGRTLVPSVDGRARKLP